MSARHSEEQSVLADQLNTSLDEGLGEKEVANRIYTVVGLLKQIFRWGIIPAILYMGFQHGPDPGQPEFTLLGIIWGQ